MVIQNFRLIYFVKHDVEDGIEHRVQNSMLSSLSRRYFFFYYSVICSSECASTAEFGLCMKKKIKVETDTKEEKTNLMGQVILLYTTKSFLGVSNCVLSVAQTQYAFYKPFFPS